jgi:hypothetical protein
MIFYGGTVLGALNAFADLWAMSLASPAGWTRIVTSGTDPGPRFSPYMIYDIPRDRILLFGGTKKLCSSCFVPQNDLWELNLSGTPTWTQLTPSGTPPPPRAGGRAIYDPVRDRMVILAGSGTTPTGAWALSLSGTPTWSDLTPWGAPHATSDFEAVYDPLRDRAIVMRADGSGRISTLDFRDSPPLWTQIYPSGLNFGTRLGPAVAYDPDDDLVLFFGGSSTNGTYRLDMGGGYLLDVGGTNGTVLPTKWCYSPGEVAEMIASPNQGYSFSQWFGDASGTSNPTQITMNGYKIVRAEFVQNVTGVDQPPVAFGLSIRPNPAVGVAGIEYSLPRAAPVRLRVFDVSGREVASLVDGMQPAGRHVAQWGAMDRRSVHAGIYIVRFETPSGTQIQRLALLR